MTQKDIDPEIQGYKAEETFDTAGFILECLSKWKWFAICVVVCLIGAYFYVASQVPRFQINAAIYLNSQSVHGANSIMMDGENPLAIRDYIDQSDMEIMKSQNNLLQIVDSLDLAYTYWRKGTLRNYPLYRDNPVSAMLDSVSLHNLKSPVKVWVKSTADSLRYDITVKSRYKTIKEEKTFDNVELPLDVELAVGTLRLDVNPLIAPLDGTELITISNPRSIARAISGSLNIEQEDNAYNIMHITLSTNDIDEGEDIVYALLHFFNQQIVAEQNLSAVQTEAFILDRLVGISDELQDVEQRLQDYRQRHNISDLRLQASINLNQKSTSEAQLAQVEAEQQIIQSIESIVSATDTYQTVPSVTNNQALTQIIEAYNKKVAQYNRALAGSTFDNPLVRSMRDDLNRDKTRILQNIATVKNGLQSRKNSILDLERQNSSELASQPAVDKGMQEIFREQQVKVNIYTFLLQRREEIALQKTMATAPARLIDDPQGTGPVSPRRQMIYLMALLLGLLLPAAYLYLKRMLFPSFNDQSELEKLTNVPVIGEICTVKKVADDDIVVGENTDTPVAELFRLLRNNLNFTINGSNNKVMLVTSAISGEGKTFVALNLAMTYALTAKRVVVVGMDVRRPILSARLGLSGQQGVTTYLSGQTSDIASLIHVWHGNTNLSILPAGPVPPNPNELLMSGRMKDLIDYLRQNYDYVIIDSAPIGVISDTLLITKYTDIQLFVTRAGYSSKRCIKILHSAYNSKRLSSVYAIVNGVNMSSNAYVYRRYGHYGITGTKNKSYGYGYTSGTRKNK